jgi:hypothetical protein
MSSTANDSATSSTRAITLDVAVRFAISQVGERAALDLLLPASSANTTATRDVGINAPAVTASLLFGAQYRRSEVRLYVCVVTMGFDVLAHNRERVVLLRYVQH